MTGLSLRGMVHWGHQALAWTTPRERMLLVWLTLGYVVSVLAETGGVGLIYVYFMLALNPERLATYKVLLNLINLFGLNGDRSAIIFLTFAVMIVFILRTLLLAWLKWFSLTLRIRLQRRISTSLFDYYVYSKFLDHQLRKLSEIMNNIWANSAAAVTNCTLGVVDIVSSFVLVLGFAIVVAIAQPVMTAVAVFMISLLFAAYWLMISTRIEDWGARGVVLTNRMFSIVNEVFPGFKTVKVFRLERSFSDRFRATVMDQTAIVRLNAMLQEAPRLTLELVVIVSILALVGGIFIQGGDAKQVIPTLVLFGMAAVRIIPAASRVVNCLQSFKFSIPALELSLKDYLLIDKNALYQPGIVPPPPAEPIGAIQLENVSFSYPGQTRAAISGVTLEVRHGEFVGFVGRSGSGKSTTADILLGLLTPAAGRILVNGVACEHVSDYGDSFSFVPQDPLILSDSIADNIALPTKGHVFNSERLKEAIQDSALGAIVDRLPMGQDSQMGDGHAKLSGGEAQRLNLARALYSQAPILVLDEPTSALDSVTEKIITETLLRLHGKRTVIMIAHRLHTLQHCDRIYFFKDGQLDGSGKFTELLDRNDSFRQMVQDLRLPNELSNSPDQRIVDL